ncbi:MAG: nucleoside triphosphate pyrophosphohydrolase [Haliscomenobacter sp.]|nr:nucleoside triphosphate pyrophosphohydrolase [Haliscomenobacter sp.]
MINVCFKPRVQPGRGKFPAPNVAQNLKLSCKETEAFGRLLQTMDELREQCPWDRKQTFQTLRNLTIEETYELAEAILEEDMEGIREELGDLMLHMVFYAKIAEEQRAFDIADALNAICEKLIKRHPHIYGDVKVADDEEVKKNWEQLKLQEGKRSVLAGVPNSLPAMVKAYRMQEKTKQVGFEWENAGQVWEKVEEEMRELREVLDQPAAQEEREEEFGDVLFSLINYARFIGVDPETALERVNMKFKRRFEYVEIHAPRDLREMTLAEMDALWEQAKLDLKRPLA